MNELCDLQRYIDIVDSDDEDGSDNVVGATTEEIITMFWGTSQWQSDKLILTVREKHR